MDDIAISKYCVGYYWGLNYNHNGPFAEDKFKAVRSPAVVYRPSVPNPKLEFNVVCPVSESSIIVSAAQLHSVALVPRCTCVEEDQSLSLQSQPQNVAYNGNFANFDLTQENPMSGWISQENWRGQAVPVLYTGPAQAADTSNQGSV